MSIKVPDLPILLVDDEEQACKNYITALETAFINNVISCHDSREVMQLLSREKVGVVVLDIMMPHISGKELLSQIANDFPDMPVIMLTAIDEVNTAVECMRKGAFDYMTKPVEKERLVSGIKRAIEMRELREANMKLTKNFFSDDLEHPEAFSEIVTNNKSMQAVFRYVEAIAKTSRSVLITGETGVGKELIAKSIHDLSGRQGVLVPVNVGGLDDNAFSDTLFGHKKGAFTGAGEARKGLIEKASGGTLFLDEIGDLEPASQVKLLRLLQEGEYYPLGSAIRCISDTRIIASTNCNLHKLIDAGKFRKDLFYRLVDHQLELPPLRKRLDDLPALVYHFLEKAASDLDKKKPELKEGFLELLSGYPFPGNIRELQGMIFDALTWHKGGRLSLDWLKEGFFKGGGIVGRIGDSDDSEKKPTGSGALDLERIFDGKFPSVNEVEVLLIKEAMKRAEGNQSVASRMLGLSRPTLNKRLKRLSLLRK